MHPRETWSQQRKPRRAARTDYRSCNYYLIQFWGLHECASNHLPATIAPPRQKIAQLPLSAIHGLSLASLFGDHTGSGDADKHHEDARPAKRVNENMEAAPVQPYGGE